MRDPNDSAVRREFHRVGQQIPDDLLQAIRVAMHPAGGGVERLFELHALSIRRGTG